MPHEIELTTPPERANDAAFLKECAANVLGADPADIQYIRLLRKSLDARKKDILYQFRLRVFLQNETVTPEFIPLSPKTVSPNKSCHIIGFGPAGIFAALQLLEMGIRPIIWERGKNIHERLKDLAPIHKQHFVNPESNYCFGEGGAGTYSDGKLYTRSTKRGDVRKVLELFVRFGADPKIAWEAHPHIGTNKLPRIIEQMRKEIESLGGIVHFNRKLSDVTVANNQIIRLTDQHGVEESCEKIILATGHSARDIFTLLHQHQIALEAKPFALGVRIEHPQAFIDETQYKRERGDYLPPATYSLVTQVNGLGVFSFCMCPGGIIAPAATNSGEIVVNGWSASKRNGRYANSGLVVSVEPRHWQHWQQSHGPLAALAFQQQAEQIAFQSTGNLSAPAQRVSDFMRKTTSSTLPRNSYQPGTVSLPLQDILPPFVANALQKGLTDFNKKMKGFTSEEAIMIGVESRTSSPVRIPRDKQLLHHPQITNLFPCGEGAGYAGGIVSAGLDGMACAEKTYAMET